ncbi:CotH kinase family protein, partial [uncultured Slackia sp.]|uniref:CotH kinase family protein n=1 Tax=uncultured Slackia sp. TaxID=665903 RepID=UPI002604C1BC
MKDSLPLYRDFSSIHAVDPEYYSAKYDVKRGLRNADGTGVLHQSARPVVVYLNGEYWGHYNLRERVN